MSSSDTGRTVTVACQGTRGAYSQLAAEKMFPDAAYIYFRTFDAVARAVREGMCTYGVLPVENNTYGSVKEVYRVIARHRLPIVKGCRLPVRHVLLAKPGTLPGDVKQIYSHEQALGQCAAFLHSLGDAVEVIPCLNTAVAAREVSESDASAGRAAIASPECADIYGLQVIRRGIADTDTNYTRFAAVAAEEERRPGANRVSLMLTLPHRVGALAGVLSEFARAGLNLLKIESGPIPGRDFEFLFYIDIEAPDTEEKLTDILGKLRRECPDFTFLGMYPETADERKS